MRVHSKGVQTTVKSPASRLAGLAEKHQWMADWESSEMATDFLHEQSKQASELEDELRPTKPKQALIHALKKIPIFAGLGPTKIQKVLAHGSLKTYAPDETIYQIDSYSSRMHILLTGQLVVLTKDGLEVGTIKPVTTVGEMGIIARHPFTVSVMATRPCQMLCLEKERFDLLLQDDRNLQTVMYRNLIAILSARLLKDNVRTRDHFLEIEHLQALVTQEQQRTQLALNIVEESGFFSRDEALVRISDELEDTRAKILIADDEIHIRDLIKKVFSTYMVFEAEDGEQALEIAQRENLSVVITDISMPNMNGIDLLSKLRDQYPNLPVLGISGYIDAQTLEEQGFDGFLLKPMPLRDLKKIVTDHLHVN